MALTAEQRDELREELQAPAYADLLAAGRHNAVADLLNAPTVPARRFVPVKDVLIPFLGNSGITVALKMLKYNPNLPEATSWQLRAAVEATETMLEAHDYIDLDGPVAQQMIGTFQAAGVITAAQVTALVALGDTRVSRAEQLWGAGASVSAEDVAEALHGG
jgi:hypothetical protein